MDNPFSQGKELWKLVFSTRYKNIKKFEDYFDERCLAISSHEIESETVESMSEDLWLVEVYFAEKILSPELPNDLLGYIEPNSIICEHVKNEDWTNIAASSLGEIQTNKFHIIRSAEALIDNKIPIILDLTRAFGTGEHATTLGCLSALESLPKDSMQNIIDIGTGTGILAIAAKKLWPHASVVGSDIDQVAVDVAKHHATINDVEIEFIRADGAVAFVGSRKYDIVLANILARPLIEIAADIGLLVNDGAIVILSGFLENQMEEVLKSYEEVGFTKLSDFISDRWVTLMLEMKK